MTAASSRFRVSVFRGFRKSLEQLVDLLYTKTIGLFAPDFYAL